MISYLKGKIIFKREKFIILDVKGVGYKVFLSKETLSKIPEIKESLKVFCYLDSRRNNLDLYGFLKSEELEFFQFLKDIPSIGPKSALEIAHLGPIDKIKKAIEKDDKKIIDQIYDIGKKKGQRIILEISREIKKPKSKKKVKKGETFQALKNLGFSSKEIRHALSKVPRNIKDTEKRVKRALKILGK